MNIWTGFELTSHNINTWGLQAVELNKTVGKVFLLLEEKTPFDMRITNNDDFAELKRQRIIARAMIAQHPESFELSKRSKND